jgi:hypothetical protein
MSYRPPDLPGQRQLPGTGRIAAAIGTAADIATILTFIFTHPWDPPPPEPTSPTSTTSASTILGNAYPLAAQQSWMNDCEARNNSQSRCACELSYFEQHASYSQFQQAYGAMPPGVVPQEFSGALSCPS